MHASRKTLLLSATVGLIVALSACGELGDTPIAPKAELESAAKPVLPPLQIPLDQGWLEEIHKAHGYITGWKTLAIDQYESNNGVYYALPEGWDVTELKLALLAVGDELRPSVQQDIRVRVPEGDNPFPHDVTFYQMDRFAKHKVVYMAPDPHRYSEQKIGKSYFQFTLVPPIPGQPLRVDNLLVKPEHEFAPGLLQVDRFGENWPLPDREAGVMVPAGPPPVDPDD